MGQPIFENRTMEIPLSENTLNYPNDKHAATWNYISYAKAQLSIKNKLNISHESSTSARNDRKRKILPPVQQNVYVPQTAKEGNFRGK